MEIAAPAAPIVGSLDPVASQVTTQTPVEETKIAPQAETPAGEQAASEDTQKPEDAEQKQTWKDKRQERNKQRWQEYKAGRESLMQRISYLEAEVKRGRDAKAPDFSKITDPTEELAERTAWKVRQAQTAETEQRLVQEKRSAAFETQERMAAAWQEAVEDARTRIPDFDAVVTDKTPIHPWMAPYIVESDKGTDVAYWLGKHPAEARSLAELFDRGSPQALIELGRIEARLSAPTPKTLSTAPKPAQVITGGVNPLQFDAGRASVGDTAEVLRKAGLIR